MLQVRLSFFFDNLYIIVCLHCLAEGYMCMHAPGGKTERFAGLRQKGVNDKTLTI